MIEARAAKVAASHAVRLTTKREPPPQRDQRQGGEGNRLHHLQQPLHRLIVAHFRRPGERANGVYDELVAGMESAMDAITLLKQDHKSVKDLFSQFEKTSDGGKREELVAQIITELTVHAEIEEEVFYPAVRREVPDIEDDILESYEEHRVAVWMMSQLGGLSPEDERYEARVMVFKEIVEHHVEEEEQQWFPDVRSSLGRKELAALGAALEEAKQRRGMPLERPTAKKATARKSAAKRAPAKKAAAAKTTARKSTAKKATPAKKR